ncbi:fungal specific transcription factor [Pseudohyphozyma bogoriensis]|nr:fungal specific transcription factor [Pseudohyphozyma bogoriensis]
MPGTATNRAKARPRSTSSGSSYRDSPPNVHSATDRNPKTKRRRAYVSCEHCINRKLKCDRKEKCGPCQMRGLDCVWVRGVPAFAADTTDVLHAEIGRLRSVIETLSTRLENAGISSKVEGFEGLVAAPGEEEADDSVELSTAEHSYAASFNSPRGQHHSASLPPASGPSDNASNDYEDSPPRIVVEHFNDDSSGSLSPGATRDYFGAHQFAEDDMEGEQAEDLPSTVSSAPAITFVESSVRSTSVPLPSTTPVSTYHHHSQPATPSPQNFDPFSVHLHSLPPQHDHQQQPQLPAPPPYPPRFDSHFFSFSHENIPAPHSQPLQPPSSTTEYAAGQPHLPFLSTQYPYYPVVPLSQAPQQQPPGVGFGFGASGIGRGGTRVGQGEGVGLVPPAIGQQWRSAWPTPTPTATARKGE